MYQDLIERYNTGRFTKLKSARFKALLNCLSPEDACRCTLEMLASTQHDLYASQAMSQKLKADIIHDGWQDFHTTLSLELLEIFDTVTAREEQQPAYVLGVIASLQETPDFLKRGILPRLLASDYISVRKHAYDLLHEIEATSFATEIEMAWLEYKDTGCAKLIVEKLPADLQDRYFDSLWEAANSWTTTALFLNVPLTPDRLARLKATDGITYAYICAKRDVMLSNEEAVELWEQYKKDERAGLLMWCFGQMKMEKFLAEVELGKRKKPDDSPQSPSDGILSVL